ncbi:MAG: DUF2808 domain-containing protein [Vulcanococcus sp.]
MARGLQFQGLQLKGLQFKSLQFKSFRLKGLLAAGLLSLPVAAPLATALTPAPASALELNGQTYFTQPPWKVDLRYYYWYANQAMPEIYFTVTLAENAGADLGGLVITQTRGVDRNFSLAPQRARAFLGLPRQEGMAVPVEAEFDDGTRTMRVQFPQPVQPGQTVTLVLRPPLNPMWADTYMFAVQALPAGPNPVPASLGFATMDILNRTSW